MSSFIHSRLNYPITFCCLLPQPPFQSSNPNTFHFPPLSKLRKCSAVPAAAPRSLQGSKSLTMLFTSSLRVTPPMFEPSIFRFHFFSFTSSWSFSVHVRPYSYSLVFSFSEILYWGLCFLACGMGYFRCFLNLLRDFFRRRKMYISRPLSSIQET